MATASRSVAGPVRVVGVGSDDLRLTVGEEVTETDLSMRMGAVGLRGALISAAEAGGNGPVIGGASSKTLADENLVKRGMLFGAQF